MSVKKIPTALALALMVSGGAVAGFAAASIMHVGSDASGSVSKAQANVIVGKLTHHQARVTQVFKGPAGLTGVIISGQQGPVVSWITNTKSAVIVGGVVDTKTNKNLTMQASIQYLSKPQTTFQNKPSAQTAPLPVSPKPVLASDTTMQGSDGESLLRKFIQASQSGTMVQVSQPGLTGPHTLYAFVDPNCIFCHKLFDEVQAHQAEFQQAGVRVVYVPVAILKQSSIAKAAEVAKEGWPALLRDEQRFDVNSEEGGIAGLSGSALSSYAQSVQGNTDWLKNLSAANHTGEGTPFLVWQAGNGRAYFLGGFPSEQGLHALFASMQPGWSPKKK
ncbi:hypothetical protein HAQ01_03955 [Acidithiobacillus thiooxidans]|uniref:hypothetical protein n=1 Tax=Acidithiobacillus thiooxidans TaxID=930 RepID=UPI001C074BBF|nr:hypothetical protein [Acidithiobacillus thiooxidans]MBU2792579.1 hypothetical protein [Acidithiobacillus thiooxidans]